MTSTETLLTSPGAVHALREVLGSHELVDSVVTRFRSWEELSSSSAGERAYRCGAWAAQLSVPARAPMLPDLGPGVEALSRYERSYPGALLRVSDAPGLLYTRAVLRGGAHVGIGGTHFPSPGALSVVDAVVRVARELDVTVVGALDSGLGHAALLRASAAGVKAVAVASCDLRFPSSNADLIGKVLEARGSVVSEWGPGEEFSESRVFTSERLVAGLSSVVVIPELGTHLRGGASLARACVEAQTRLVVPRAPEEAMVEAASTGVAVLARARSFSPKFFGSTPMMEARVRSGRAAADAVVSSEADVRAALKELLGR
jgi:hypothetical protein